MWLYKVAYAGGSFSGSQVQPDKKTVEGDLQDVIGVRCRLMSRTDAGVSAKGNVLPLNERINVGKINSQLRDISLWAEACVDRVPKVKHRHYRYFFVERGNFKPMKKFEGTHDFSEFTRSKKDAVRTVHVRLGKFKGFDYVDFFSKGFLWNQVRRMVGSLEGKTAPPEPLVLVNIEFEEEPEWTLHRKWLEMFRRTYQKEMARSLVLGSWLSF